MLAPGRRSGAVSWKAGDSACFLSITQDSLARGFSGAKSFKMLAKVPKEPARMRKICQACCPQVEE